MMTLRRPIDVSALRRRMKWLGLFLITLSFLALYAATLINAAIIACEVAIC